MISPAICATNDSLAEEGGSGKCTWCVMGAFKRTWMWRAGGIWAIGCSGRLGRRVGSGFCERTFFMFMVAAQAAMAADRGRSRWSAATLDGQRRGESTRVHVPQRTRALLYIIFRRAAWRQDRSDLAEVDLMVRSLFNTTSKMCGVDPEDRQGRGADDGNNAASKRHLKRCQHYSDDRCRGWCKEPAGSGRLQDGREQERFALELQKMFKMDNVPSLDTTNEIEPLRKFDPNEPAASTDVGDVSWNVPTIGFSAATWVPVPQPTPGRRPLLPA